MVNAGLEYLTRCRNDWGYDNRILHLRSYDWRWVRSWIYYIKDIDLNFYRNMKCSKCCNCNDDITLYKHFTFLLSIDLIFAILLVTARMCIATRCIFLWFRLFWSLHVLLNSDTSIFTTRITVTTIALRIPHTVNARNHGMKGYQWHTSLVWRSGIEPGTHNLADLSKAFDQSHVLYS